MSQSETKQPSSTPPLTPLTEAKSDAKIDSKQAEEAKQHAVVIHVEAILQIRQYSERTKAVFAWGKQTDQKFQIDTFGESTFEALAGICAARGALENKHALRISPSKFVTHPSSLVRSTSVSSGLLSSEEAKAIFLSEDSSRETQRMLVRTCDSLPADEDTIAFAQKLDEEGGFQGGGMAWTVLIRTSDEAFFLKHASLCTPAARAWQQGSGQPLSLALVNRFPEAVLELAINKGMFKWEFNWLCALAQQKNNAQALFRFLLNAPKNSSLSSMDGLVLRVVRWGWKPYYSLLLAIVEKGEMGGAWTRVSMLRALRESRATFNMKLEAILSVFPKISRPEELAGYINLLPKCKDAKRSEHCAELLTGFWGLLSVANSKQPWQMFRELATNSILPSNVLVQEFLLKQATTSSFLIADVTVWKKQELDMFLFILKLCKFDNERLQVLRAFFSRADIAFAEGALQLFLSFRTTVESSVALREGFNALSSLLGGKAVKSELQAVVAKMRELEEKESIKNPSLKKSSEDLPRNWVSFCSVDSSFSSVGLFLRATLLNLAEGPLLPSLVAKFGREWFWDIFETVLKGAEATILASQRQSASSVLSTFPSDLLAELPTFIQTSVDQKNVEQKNSSSNNNTTSQIDPIYQAKEEEVKKRTFGKDYAERQKAYLELVQLSQRGADGSKQALYNDLVPFIVKRLDREQETVKFAVLPDLLNAFPAALWIPQIKEHLAMLWHSCFNARTTNTSWKPRFSTLCNKIMQKMLANEEWEKRSVAAVEVCTTVLSDVDPKSFGNLLISSLEAKASQGETLHEDAIEWCVENALGAQPTARELLSFVRRLEGTFGSQAEVWRRIPGIFRRWRVIHEAPVTPANVEFLLRDSYAHFDAYNKSVLPEEHFWDPILDATYQTACTKALSQLSELVGPAKALEVCQGRLKQFDAGCSDRESRVRASEETLKTATTIVNTVRGPELRGCLKTVLSIIQAKSHLPLPSLDLLLAASLNALDAVEEGRARVVCREDSEFATRWESPSLLSELLDHYLTVESSEVLDERVLELSDRADAHLLLFFGERFLKHLCLRRQAELHSFLEKLTPFPTDATSIQDFEFYHWELTEHSLARLTTLHVPLAMLHPTTQNLLLHKGLLGSTRLSNLSALPMLEFVDTTPNILAILDAHPRAQSSATPAAVAAASSLNPSLAPKNSNDLEEVANLRFRNLRFPIRTDEVQQKHVDTLILALGHADHTDRAMAVLSKYAGWHKFARDALVRTIKTLSKPHARRVLTQLITPSKENNGEKMGLSTLVHMLRLALELRVDRVVDLCIGAFREGACHRDILAVMLSKLVVFEGFSQEELARIRVLYNLSSTSRDKDDQTYIARTVLQDIKNLRPWTLPFVCEVVSSDWCYVPGIAGAGFSALLSAPSCGANITHVAQALTSVLSSARVLANVEFHDSHDLANDWKAVNGQGAANALVSSEKLNQCERGVLLELVREIFSSPSISQHLAPALDLWLPLAETDLNEVDWLATRLKEFELSKMNGAFQQLVDITVARSGRPVARRVVQIAREVVGLSTDQGAKLLVSGWAKLVANDSDEKELKALLSDPVALENVSAVAKVLVAGCHKWAALEWLSQSKLCMQAPHPGLPALVELCVAVFAEKDVSVASVQRVLDLFSQHKDSPLCIKLVEGLATNGPVNKEAQRLGLQWLTPLFPRAVVQMYPKFLSRFEPPSVEDVDSLLAVCVKYHLEFPPLAPGVCRVACRSLLSSPIVEARVLAARVLGKDQRVLELKKLLLDESPVVRSAVQSLLPPEPKVVKSEVVPEAQTKNPEFNADVF